MQRFKCISEVKYLNFYAVKMNRIFLDRKPALPHLRPNIFRDIFASVYLIYSFDKMLFICIKIVTR